MIEFLGFLLFTGASMLSDLPSDAELASYQPSGNVVAVDRAGTELFYVGERDREILPLDQIPDRVVGAFLSAEDRRFFEHSGFDVTAMVRASLRNATSSQGQRLVGGSTITQQLSKGVFVGDKRTIRRKLREAVVAYRWEKQVGKEQVLQIYLNEIYLGRGVFGVNRAAEVYFGKTIDRLSIAEAAAIASLVKAPSSLSREKNRKRLKARRDWVVGQMVENGYASALEGLVEKRRALTFVERKADPFVDTYYEDLVLREATDLFGSKRVALGDMVIETALDSSVQTQLEDTFRRGLLAMDSVYPFRGSFKNSKRRGLKAPKDWKLAEVVSIKSKSFIASSKDGYSCEIPYRNTLGPKFEGSPARLLSKGEFVFVEVNKNSCALRQVPEVSAGAVVLDRLTGEIRGAVGGFDYGVSEFNRAIQAQRQPGSTIKPVTYYAALDLGYSPNEKIDDKELQIELPGGRIWSPANADRSYVGQLPLEAALYRSRNVPTLTLAQELGFRTYWRYASHLGLTRLMPREWTVVLGSAPTTVVDMAGAYATMFNNGEVTPGYAITRVTSGGKVLFDPAAGICEECRETSRYMRRQREGANSRLRPRAETTSQIRGIMRKVVTQGTAARYGARMPKGTIGKTGTTNDFKDAWFIGESPSQTSRPTIMAVYVGHDVPKPITRSGTGGRIAAPFYADFWSELPKQAIKQVAPTAPDVVVYRTKSPLNFRTARSLNSSVIRVLPKGAALDDVQCDGRWCEVGYQGRRGFVSKSYLSTSTQSGQPVESRFVELRAYMRATGGTYKVTPEAVLVAQSAASATNTKKTATAKRSTRAKKTAKASKKKKK